MPGGSTVDWGPCDEPRPGVECATIKVPLDYAKPDGETIDIGLARRPAADQDNKIGSVLMDPGGPGGSGTAAIIGDQLFPKAVADRFDVVGFDPRGVGMSTQVRCDPALSAQVEQSLRPTDQAEFDRLAELNKRLSQSCREHSGALVDHIDNTYTARDMDAIRAALGEEKLNYVGYSYGTFMGQQYAEMFPERIRTMVLDGNMDHSLRTAREFVTTEVAPVEETFVQFADWCETTPSCALHGRDVTDVYADLKRKAKDGTLVDPDGTKVDFYALSSVANAATEPGQWSSVAERMKALADGEGPMAARQLTAAEPMQDVMPAVWCRDWSFSVEDYEHYAKLRKGLEKRFPNVEWTAYVDHVMRCVGSEFDNTNPRERLDIDGAPPIVMIGNRYDPATPYAWSRTAALQSGAELVTYEGYGHSVYRAAGPSPCVNSAVNEYLLTTAVPEKGLTCEAAETPAADSPGTRSRVDRSPGPYAAR